MTDLVTYPRSTSATDLGPNTADWKAPKEEGAPEEAADRDLASTIQGTLSGQIPLPSVVMMGAVESVVARGIASEDEDELAEIQRRLRDGDSTVARDLSSIVLDQGAASEDRAFALELFAAARSSYFLDDVTELVTKSLSSPFEDLMFTAVACCSELPIIDRLSLGPTIRRMEEDAETPLAVRQAAAAFLAESES